MEAAGSTPPLQALRILAPDPGPRLLYALEIIFGRMLGVAYECSAEPPQEGAWIDYRPDGRGIFRVPVSGWLSERVIRSEEPPLAEGAEGLLLFPGEGGDFSFDVFAAVFYLASDYEKYTAPWLDALGRYDSERYLSARLGLDCHPRVWEWSLALWEALVAHFGEEQLPPRRASGFRFEITFDIDAPWKHRYKALHRVLGGGLKAWAKGERHAWRERIAAWVRGEDPFDTFKRIYDWLSPEEASFFFLVERRCARDGRHTWRLPAYRDLIQAAKARGYRCGIHPSFHAGERETWLAEEAGQLARILHAPIARSRQHFLRYSYPSTFRSLLAAGIRCDYSLCLFRTGGFPCGMDRPWPWFDLLENQASALMLHPTQLMDRSLLDYLRLSPAEALPHAEALAAATARSAGRFTLLLHNESLSDSGEWQGWLPVWQALVERLRLLQAASSPSNPPTPNPLTP
jgi:hypothetical protein